MSFSSDDKRFMRRALRLAARARGRTAPNPMVGCVVTRGGEILSEGFHAKAGTAHAEVVALGPLLPEAARGATVYVTLEPCNHTGRTGPCTEALIAARVARVVVAMGDPNPQVDGGGAARLRAAGIIVETGLAEGEARALNAGFITWALRGRPRVTIKAALTLDGRLATRSGDSRWVTGEAARREVHRMRDACDAILVGAGTVRADNPRLTTRLHGGAGRDPLRVILDGALALPPDAGVMRPGTLVVTTDDRPATDKARFLDRGVELLELPAAEGAARRVDLSRLLDALGRRDVLDLLVEGGADVHGALLSAGLVDRVVAFIAPKLVGDEGIPFFRLVAGAQRDRMDDAISLHRVRVRRFGDDVMIAGDICSTVP